MEHFTEGWKVISTKQKAVLISEFLQERKEDLSYEAWVDFLWWRLSTAPIIEDERNIPSVQIADILCLVASEAIASRL